MRLRALSVDAGTTGAGTAFAWTHGRLSSLAREDQLNWFNWRTFPTARRRGYEKTPAHYQPEDHHWRDH